MVVQCTPERPHPKTGIQNNHVHTHTHTHKFIHKRTRLHMHTYTHTSKHTHKVHTNVHAHTDTHRCTKHKAVPCSVSLKRCEWPPSYPWWSTSVGIRWCVDRDKTVAYSRFMCSSCEFISRSCFLWTCIVRGSGCVISSCPVSFHVLCHLIMFCVNSSWSVSFHHVLCHLIMFCVISSWSVSFHHVLPCQHVQLHIPPCPIIRSANSCWRFILACSQEHP